MRRFVRLDLLLVVVALAAIGWGVVRAVGRARLRAEMIEIGRHVEAGRHATARGRLVELARRWPGDAEVWLQLGVCERARGDRDAAIDAWTRVPDGTAWSDRAAALRGNALIDTGRYTPAEQVLEAAVSRPGDGPDRYELERALCRLYRFEGRVDDVRLRLRGAISLAPDPTEVLKELWLLDTSPMPLEAWQTALEHADPDDDRVWLGRVHVAILTGRYDEAARRLADCIERRPDDPAVWRAKLELARATDDEPAAREALAHVPFATLDPAETLDLRAWLLRLRGDRAAERDVLRRLVELEPGRASAWDRLAALAAGSGDPDQAADLQRKKAEVDRLRDRYREILLAAGDLSASAGEFSGLASGMGRRFDALAWSSISLGYPIPPDSLGDARPIDPLDGLPALEASVAPDPARDGGATPRFEEVAESAGLQFAFDNGATPARLLPETMSGGVALLDYDRDEAPDVFVVQGGPIAAGADHPSNRLFRNRGDGTFTDVTEAAGLDAVPGDYGLGVTVGDSNNDGLPDLFLTRLRSYALLRNQGDGTFADVTETAGLGGFRSNPTSAAFADLDADGDLDLYVCHYMIWDEADPITCQNDKGENFYCDPRMVHAAPDALFRNDYGRFVDVTAESGIVDRQGRGLGVVAADFDADGKFDLFVANDGTANYLFRNLGDMKFEEVGETSGVASNGEGGYQASMGVACGDLDGDGRPDLLVTNFYGEGTTLYRNLGDGLFHDRTSAAGLMAASRHLLGFGAGLLDFDNDGEPDVVTVNGHVNDNRPFYAYAMPAQLLANRGGKLVDVSGEAGACWGVPRVGRGLAVGDVDGDGRLDAVILAQNEPLALFRNRTEGGHFISLRLEGRESNRDAVGARVTVRAGGRERVGWRTGGGSYQSADEGRLHFGLGSARVVESIEVAWPSGRAERFEGLDADVRYLLREGEGRARRIGGGAGGSR